jgi:hypothetical protein
VNKDNDVQKKKNTKSCQITTKQQASRIADTGTGACKIRAVTGVGACRARAVFKSHTSGNIDPPTTTENDNMWSSHTNSARENSLMCASHALSKRDHHNRGLTQPDWKKPTTTTKERVSRENQLKIKKSSSKDISKFCTAKQYLRWRHTTNDRSPQPIASVASAKKREQQKGKKKLHSSKSNEKQRPPLV